MIINMNLSTESIDAAIRRLEEAKKNLDWGLSETIDILTDKGAQTAQDADGGMATIVTYRPNDNTGVIIAEGEAAIIAEFGAGDATEEPTGFENQPDTPVYPGSYSESELGSGEYARTLAESGGETGYWHFGGMRYTEVEPRHGMLKAKAYIVMSAEEVAREVIKL